MSNLKQMYSKQIMLLCMTMLLAVFSQISAVNAQIKANTMLLGGSLSFDHTNGTNKIDRNGSSKTLDEPTITLFGIEPRFGYFIARNSCLGVSLDFRVTSTTQENASGESETHTNTSTLVGPFGRYYVGLSDRIYAFGEVSFAGGIDGRDVTDPVTNKLTNITVTNLQVGAGPGLNFFINDFVAFEALAKYTYSNRTFTAFGDKNVTNTNNFRFTLGLQIYLRAVSAGVTD